MVTTPKVSIIIRTLNEAAFLPTLFDLINNQSYKNFETIVVDSGSEDDTLKIAKEFSDKLLLIKRIRIIVKILLLVTDIFYLPGQQKNKKIKKITN